MPNHSPDEQFRPPEAAPCPPCCLPALAAYLASDRAPWVSGTIIMADGGQHSLSVRA